MRDDSPPWVLTGEEAERTVFGALVDAHPGPLTRHELATMLENPIAAHDAIGALVRDGVANASGELIFASRAAIRAEELHL